MTKRLSVLGAGAWGTALAHRLAVAGAEITLWARDATAAAAINETHENVRHLPGVKIDARVRATAEIADAADGDAMLLVVPAQAVRATCRALAATGRALPPVVLCAKGIEETTGALMHRVVMDEIADAKVAVLSGPSFADELARGLPAAVTLAAADDATARSIAELVACPGLRPYTSTDLVGAEIGGALKNVYAIACGIVEGRGLGVNARAALITRGFAEMQRLGCALGARPETLAGLCGLGDLVLSCTSAKSRNYAFGHALGAAAQAQETLEHPPALVEGVATAAAVARLVAAHAVDLPIAAAVDAIVHSGAAVDSEIERLLARPLRAEGP